MTETVYDPNWRKRASANMNDDDVELAFMRQAFTHIESKASPLLREPFFIGFEILEKNDANTNIVGLFAFRVKEVLLYAPVFFKNGEVKGANLLYDSKLRLFSPLSSEWCNYYVGKHGHDTGSTVDQGHTPVGRGIDFDNLRFPDQVRKSASEHWQEMQKFASSSGGTALLKKLLESEYGEEAFHKLANTVENDFDFALAMNDIYDPEEWLEAKLGSNRVEKKAAITEPESLIIHAGEYNPNSELSMREQYVYGFSFSDTRKNKAEVFENREDTGQQIVEKGLCKVLDNTGAWVEMIVVPNYKKVYLDLKENSNELTACGCGIDGSVGKNPLSTNDFHEAGYRTPHETGVGECSDYFFVDMAERRYGIVFNETLFGRFVEDGSIATRTIDPEDSSEKHIVLIDGDYVTDPFFVEFVETDDEIVTVYGKYEQGSKGEVKINKDLKCHDRDLNVWSGDTAAVVVSAPEVDGTYPGSPQSSDEKPKTYVQSNFEPGNIDTLVHFLTNNGVRPVNVKKANAHRFRIYYNGSYSREMNKLAASSVLARDLEIDGNMARELVSDAEKKGERKFLVKTARVRLDDAPENPHMTMDPEMGVMVNTPESYVLSTSEDRQPAPDHKVGDQYRMDGMQVLIETGTPQELYEASKNIKDDTLFDVGVVGSLVQTFDGSELVENYFPDLRQGLDKIGRILFLIYWKPEDFVEAYGSDDITDMENKLLSSFKQFGDLLLDLMQQFKFEDKVDMNSLGNSN